MAFGVIGAASVAGGSDRDSTSAKAGALGKQATSSGQTSAPAIEAGLLPWSLPTPLSRMVVLPGPGSDLILAGGLTPTAASSGTVETLDASSGRVSPLGELPRGVHDAAAAALHGSYAIFGGGSPATVGSVELLAFAPGGGLSVSTGELPAPRSDAVAVSDQGTTYIVGGYDGTTLSPTVLTTTDGRIFRTAAALQVPVRYPAVATSGRYIYAFGGESASGPTDVIQRIDPAHHQSSVIGHLPYPLEGAVAVTMEGQIYLAGGATPDPAAQQPAGMGVTQLDGWATSAPTGLSNSGALTTSNQIWWFDPAGAHMQFAGQLQVPVAYAGVSTEGDRAWIVGGESGPHMLATVQVMQPNRSFGTAGAAGAGSPYFGYQLLVADRGNNRLLLLDPSLHVTWSYPGPATPPDPLGFYFPDDAFFIDHGTAIISNQEENETLVEIAYPSGRIIWSYGHPRVPGSASDYLHEPDDAYRLRDGQITVADADNCRVLVIDPATNAVVTQIGTPGACFHNPPTSMGSTNGDTPLWDGNLLVSEINGSWVSEYTPAGRLVWSVQLPIAYPSDPQQLGATPTYNSDRYLIADYADPGEILQFDREGQILATYDASQGPGRLNHPSLAEELPDGIYMINDDYNHRMVAIDPADGALVWQYGVTGQPGSGPGQLNTPDGFDVLGPGGTTPTHPQTG
jgi:outer membrane protein assembly factor BamB